VAKALPIKLPIGNPAIPAATARQSAGTAPGAPATPPTTSATAPATTTFGTRSKTGRHSITSSARASSVGTARRSSITRLLLRSHHPDAAHLALLDEVNESDVALVERIVPHWGASLSGSFTHQLIHYQSFLQN
jgi:hypothetical protein